MSTQEGTDPSATSAEDVASPSISSQASFLSSPQGSLASKFATHPTPMEQDAPLGTSSTDSSNNVDSMEVQASLKEKARLLFAKYITSSQVDPGSACLSTPTSFKTT
ncbi:uncharacterized protein RHIMIDRAFT_236867 [Rhizopus microsporus ATCC 52813]|uniref:Uncharacterized protein n=1 Tax=Rhizopus microsporus ATCC 52813 TaxID=1340429 RepID=A0A2G4SYH7_RHIZD|nr:uncharacterized protein RHIMIDRAFT_236867 [Rhizopus microsporus ATCC 52813]PHZ13819.1 hypothetical protein RHIMIDRAFT_236867 [Rhizopus microsporus ATCC 52813]